MRLFDELHAARCLVAGLRSQWWPAARIEAYQEARLVAIMRHALTQVPFYRGLGISAADINQGSDLQRFPLIRKRDVQQEPRAFLADGLVPDELHASRTSGSSGEPMTTYFDRESWLLTRYALKMRRVAVTGGLPFMRRVFIVSEQRPEELDAVARAAPNGRGILFAPRYVSIHTDPQQHLTELDSFRPHIIYAFPSYLQDLVETAGRRDRPLPRVATLYTSSEVLTPLVRERIERSFRGRVYDVYGSTEFKEVAWQCDRGAYHLNFESVHVERHAAGSNAPLVLSTLCNLAMPLLRFDIGDRAVFGDDRCPCGRASPVLAAVAGREGEMIELPSGRRLSPYLLTTEIEQHLPIRKYRLIQTARDAFRVEIVVANAEVGQECQERLCAALGRIVAEPVKISLRLVDEIDRSPGGKRAVFVRAPAMAG